MAVQQREATEEWRELESDPGLFSLLVEEFGVQGVKVEEIYDVSKGIESRVYGFVFLFRYEMGDRRARKKARDLACEDVCYVFEPSVVNTMFFAHQIVINSCATHALLSVLLNCPMIELGSILTKLRDFCTGLDPESKGYAIANMAELAYAHNIHARPSNPILPLSGRKGSVVSSAHALMPETYHFVSYVPINGRLFELDGLKEYPIDHGPWGEHEEWTDLFRRTISFRLAETESFMFNLMALIPDPSLHYSKRLRTLCQQKEELLNNVIKFATETIYESTKDTPSEEELQAKIGEMTRLLPPHLVLSKQLSLEECHTCDEKITMSIAMLLINANEIDITKRRLREHLETIQRYRIEHSRRIHNYEEFITEFVRMLAQNNQLPQRVTKTMVKSVTVNNGHRRKKTLGDIQLKSKKTKTTLLVNGTKVH